MTKYVPDISSRRWVIISPRRTSRPEDHRKNTHDPFAPGHEKESPGEVYRIGTGGVDEPGWQVRVISNKYPITDLHEVVIHTPEADRDIPDMTSHQVELIFQAYRERFNYYKGRGQVLIFCNHGEQAGSSIQHPHSQLVVIPPQINLDSLTREPLTNVVFEEKSFTAYCPDFSQWPYELWIVPKTENRVYGDLDDEEIGELARLVRKSITQLYKIYQKGHYKVPFGYNYYISPRENWYMRIIPRFIHRAGFELGTGLSVNIIDPIDAAVAYQGRDPAVEGVLSKLKKNF